MKGCTGRSVWRVGQGMKPGSTHQFASENTTEGSCEHRLWRLFWLHLSVFPESLSKIWIRKGHTKSAWLPAVCWSRQANCCYTLLPLTDSHTHLFPVRDRTYSCSFRAESESHASLVYNLVGEESHALFVAAVGAPHTFDWEGHCARPICWHDLIGLYVEGCRSERHASLHGRQALLRQKSSMLIQWEVHLKLKQFQQSFSAAIVCAEKVCNAKKHWKALQESWQ